MSSQTDMPAAEAESAAVPTDELVSYELAFHVLPTVAEGEVTGVAEAIKTKITSAGGEVFAEEAPQHFDLAYEVVKYLEGKNRTFSSAYFGWIRFRLAADAIEGVVAEIEANTSIMRHLLIKLTKAEEENPFNFHDAIAAQKTVSTVEESEVVPDFTTVEKTAETEETTPAEENTEEKPDDEAIDEALKKDEA